MEDPGHRQSVLILPNGPSKPGERAHDNKFLPWVGFEPTTSWSIVQRVATELASLFVDF